MGAPEYTPAMEAVAGAIGGCAALTLTYPLQSVSTLMQMHQRRSAAQTEASPKANANPLSARVGTPMGESTSSSTDSLGPSEDSEGCTTPRANSPKKVVAAAAAAPEHSTVAVIAAVLKERNGWQGLYSGLRSALFGQLVIQAVYYYFYSLARRVATRATGVEKGVAHTAVCASLAGTVGATLTNPIWVVSTRQIKTGSQESMVSELRKLYQEEGFGGLFKGLGPALMLVSNPTIQYTAFEKLTVLYSAWKKAKAGNLSGLEIFFLSAIAKTLSTLCTYPYIMAKTTMQSQAKGENSATQYASSWECVCGVREKEGLSGLYAGINSKIWQSVLTASLLFVLHAKCLKLVKALMSK